MTIPKAEKDRIINRYLESTQPKERECWACGKTYTGLHGICGSEVCWAAWQAHYREIRRRHPVSFPRGHLFFQAFRDGVSDGTVEPAQSSCDGVGVDGGEGSGF